MTVDTRTSNAQLPLVVEPRTAHNAKNEKWHKPIISLPDSDFENQRVFKTYPFVTMPINRYFQFLASHEFAMLRRAEHFSFTPSAVQLHSDRRTISYQHLQGKTIKQLNTEGKIPDSFFKDLYQSVKELHKYQLVHMDLGNSGNIIARESGQPAIIDFGSAIDLKRLPFFLRNWMKRKDLLGVLKLWHRFDKGSMPEKLCNYYRKHYRKNIYTPKRLKKALSGCLSCSHGNNARLCPGLIQYTGIISLFIVFFLANAVV